MTLPRADLLAIVVAGIATLAIATIGLPASQARPLSEQRARHEAATYLTAEPAKAELHAAQWEISDGRDTAWIDARTGELIEIEFAGP